MWSKLVMKSIVASMIIIRSPKDLLFPIRKERFAPKWWNERDTLTTISHTNHMKIHSREPFLWVQQAFFSHHMNEKEDDKKTPKIQCLIFLVDLSYNTIPPTLFKNHCLLICNNNINNNMKHLFKPLKLKI